MLQVVFYNWRRPEAFNIKVITNQYNNKFVTTITGVTGFTSNDLITVFRTKRFQKLKKYRLSK